MLSYFSRLMQDAIELSLGTARKAHAVVLQEMEKGKFTWNEPDLVECYKQRRVVLLVILKSVFFTTKERARMIMIMLFLASCNSIVVLTVIRKQRKHMSIQLINVCV